MKQNLVERSKKHIESALKSMLRHLGMSLSSFTAISITLILMSVFLLLAGNLMRFTSTIQTELKIHVAIDTVAEAADVASLEEQLKGMKEITSVSFSSRENELDKLIENSGSLFGEYRESNPLNDIYIVEVEDAKQIPEVTKNINLIKGVENAQYGGDSISSMIDIFTIIRNGGAIFVILLGLLATFLVSTTIKMTIRARKKEIAIMRSVGASNDYIQMPFKLEGLFIGILGSIIPIIFTIGGYLWLYNSLNGQFLSKMLIMEKPFPFVLIVCIVLLVCGALVGFIGSYLSVRKFLRWSR